MRNVRPVPHTFVVIMCRSGTGLAPSQAN